MNSLKRLALVGGTGVYYGASSTMFCPTEQARTPLEDEDVLWDLDCNANQNVLRRRKRKGKRNVGLPAARWMQRALSSDIILYSSIQQELLDRHQFKGGIQSR